MVIFDQQLISNSLGTLTIDLLYCQYFLTIGLVNDREVLNSSMCNFLFNF